MCDGFLLDSKGKHREEDHNFQRKFPKTFVNKARQLALELLSEFSISLLAMV